MQSISADVTTDRAELANTKTIFSPEEEDFSLVLGGPLYQLFVRAKMARPTMELVHRRILAFVIVAWIPLAVLTALNGTFTGRVAVPFLVDLDAHVRFLLTLPLLIAAELIVHRRMRLVVMQFVERGLIAPEDRPHFDALIAQAMRIRNSAVVELALLALSFTAGYWFWRTHVILHVSTWYALPREGGIELSAAGYWYALVSLPIVRFVLMRWYFRLFVWYVFLWRVSRMKLGLNAMHPDRAGGLGFVATSVYAFAPVMLAQTIFLSGIIGNQIWHAGEKLPTFKYLIAAFIAALMVLTLLPLVFFAGQMAASRRIALRECGLLACQYVAKFKEKWIDGHNPSGEPLLGSADIQSLADLGNSFEVVREMGLLPFNKRMVVSLAVVLALPLFPLLLTMIPFDELMQRLIHLAI